MRLLAQRLGVTPNALYSHVESKIELIDAVLDDVLAQVETPAVDVEDSIAGVHALMTSTYDVLLAHSELVPLYLQRQGARGPIAQQLGDVMLALLRRAGVTGPQAREALRVLVIYTIGFAAFATRLPIAGSENPDPPLAEARRSFERGLEWLLTGIGRRPS